MNDNTCICCGEQIPEGMQVCPKCAKDGDIGMELVFDEESGTWGEAPKVYGVINCPTKEDYEYALNAIKSHKQLEGKHWNECRQIAHYEDELRKAKELLRETLPILHRAFFADYKDTNAANELYDKIRKAVGGVE